MRKQNQGDLSTRANDGRLTVRHRDHNEYVDKAPGKTVVVEFTCSGTGQPGSFGYMGVGYALGNPAYEGLGNGRYRLTLSAEPLPDQTGTFYVRYTPRPDDDRDLIDVTVSLPVRVNETGYTTTMVVQAGILTVDAAADKPVSVNGARALDGSYTAAVSGQEAGVRVQATFGDYTDDSESHYLIFDLSSGINGLNLSSLPAGYQWSVLTAAQAQAAGLGDYADGARYVIPQVPNDYLRANNGVFNNVIRATVDQVTTDSTLTFKFKAVAVENNNDGELTPSNNIAETAGSFSMAAHVITSVPLVRAGAAPYNAARQAPTGQDGSHGPPLSPSGQHASATLPSITFPSHP